MWLPIRALEKNFSIFKKTAHERIRVVMPIKWKTASAICLVLRRLNSKQPTLWIIARFLKSQYETHERRVEPFPDRIRQARFQSSFALLKNELHKAVLAAANGHRRKPKRENSKVLTLNLRAWDTDFCNWFLLLAGPMVGQSSEGSVIYGKCCARQNM